MGKNTSTLVTDEYAKEKLTPIERTEIDPWTKLAKDSGLYESGLKYCIENDIELGFRGEVHGAGLRGSGNKNNPSRNLPATLTLFGIDYLSNGFALPQHDNDTHSSKNVSEAIEVDYTKPVADVVVNSVDELVEIANGIFEEEKKYGRIIEGVVVRTRDSLDLSFKIMNDEYDASK